MYNYLLTSHKFFKYVALTWILLIVSIIILIYNYNYKYDSIEKPLDTKYILYPILSNIFYILVIFYNSQYYLIESYYIEFLIIIINIIFIYALIKKILLLNKIDKENKQNINEYHLSLIIILIIIIWCSILFLQNAS